MSTTSVRTPGARGGLPPGATALSALDPGRPPRRHRRHVLGDAARAVSVFAGAVFDVLVRGEYVEVRDGGAGGTRC